jgi:hypothetical protein
MRNFKFIIAIIAISSALIIYSCNKEEVKQKTDRSLLQKINLIKL